MAKSESDVGSFKPISAGLPLLQEMLRNEGRFRVRLHGSSMRPTLPEACEIEIVPAPPRLHLGDIVVFEQQDDLVAHRIVAFRRGAWITQGDSQPRPDAQNRQGGLLGLVSAAYLGGRRCWPPRAARMVAAVWVARAWALWVKRRLNP